MGCDIHLFTERKRHINNQEKWVSIDRFKMNPYYGEDETEEEFECVEMYSGRNYSLFAVLADVRNYSKNKYISQPKGFPDNCSEFVNKEKERWDGDGHSHSYFTLKELKEFRNKNKITKYSGMVSPEGAKQIDNGEMPNSWCKSTNIPSYVYREWEYETDTLGVIVEALENRVREELWLCDNADTTEHDENFRIVFWFDN